MPHYSFSQNQPISKFETAKAEFKKGIYFYNQMRYLGAVEFFRNAVSIYPEYYTAREYLARSYRLSGFTDEALTQWENLLDLTSDNVSIQNKINAIRLRKVSGLNSQESTEFVLSSEIDSSKFERFRFQKPVDIAVDKEKNIYITSFSSGKIVKLDINGNGVATSNIGLGSRFYGIDIYNTTLAVSDFKKDAIYLLNFDLRTTKTFGSSGNIQGSFHGPQGLCFDPRGNLFIVDSGNHRIQKFDDEGKFIFSFGTKGEYEGQLNNPTDIAFYNQRLFVTDTGNRRLSCFDDSGNFIENKTFEGMDNPRGISNFNDLLAISDEKKGLLLYNMQNEKVQWPELIKDSKSVFSKLISSTYDREGFLYTVDYNYEKVFIFSPLEKRYTNLDIEVTSVDTNKYPIVAVYLNVRNRSGYPVYGLKSENFKIIEDGSKISGIYADYLKDANSSASFILCVDRSLSNQGYHNEIPWVSEFILKKMKKNDSLKQVNFNKDYWVGNNFDWSRRRTLKAIKKREYGEGKNIGRVLYNAVSDLLPRINRRGVVLITDGTVQDDSFQKYSADNVIDYAKSHYIPIYIITFRDKHPVLKRISEETGGAIYKASEIDGLRSIYGKVRNGDEYRYALVFYSFKRSDFSGWWSDLKIEVDYMGQKGFEWGGYFVP